MLHVRKCFYGIVGVTTAHSLASRGRNVLVLDRRSGPALGTSYINGTLICPSLMLPWTGRQMIPKLFKSFLDSSHPLKVHPRSLVDPALWHFGIHYLAACKTGHYATSTGRLARLAAYSRRCLDRLLLEDPSLGTLMDQTAKGTLQVFDSREALQNCLDASEEIRSAGIPLNVLSPEECDNVDPAVVQACREQGKEVVYLYSDLDTNGDIYKLTKRLVDLCKSMGGRFEYDCKVKALKRSSGGSAGWLAEMESGRELHAENIVLCGGVETPALAASLGLKLPMYPVKGYAITVPLRPGASQLRSNVVQDAKKLYLAPLGPDKVRITGCAEFAGMGPGATDVDMRRAGMLTKQAEQLMPDMVDVSNATYYAGLRPLSADDVPILGEASPGVFLNTGHGSKGWTHAFGSAELIADVVAGRSPALDLTPYAFSRFWPRIDRARVTHPIYAP